MDWSAGDEAHWLELLSNGTGCRGVAGSHQSGRWKVLEVTSLNPSLAIILLALGACADLR